MTTGFLLVTFEPSVIELSREGVVAIAVEAVSTAVVVIRVVAAVGLAAAIDSFVGSLTVVVDVLAMCAGVVVRGRGRNLCCCRGTFGCSATRPMIECNMIWRRASHI